jgi:hypothetical protein
LRRSYASSTTGGGPRRTRVGRWHVPGTPRVASWSSSRFDPGGWAGELATESFKFSTDPQLEAKIRDVVGLYLHPPERAIVVCVDEKSQIQALSRTAPDLLLRPGSPQRRTHDYVRHGTTTLFAALEVATGRVTDQCFDRHRHAELLAFLKLVAKATRGGSCTWCSTTTALTPIPRSRAGSSRIRVHPHFTPTSASWMNLVEVFFSIITRQAIQRGSFASVGELVAAIRRFVDGWNERSQPFVWSKTPTTS